MENSNAEDVPQAIQLVINILPEAAPPVDQYRYQKRYQLNRYHNDPEFKKKVNAKRYENMKRKKAADAAAALAADAGLKN